MSAAITPKERLERLDWTVIRRLDGLLQGDYRTLFKGHGLDLADIREYEPGDDVRYIDWNVTARMDRPYVREYLEDREVSGWFLLDLSPSVDFGTAEKQKRDLLLDFTGVLARLLTRHGNRVGAILYGGRVERTVPAGSGRVQVLRILHDATRQPRLKRAPFTSLAELLEAAIRTMKRRSLVFVVSDFITMPGWERPLGVLTRRHEVLAIRLVDPREQDLPDIGPAIFEDAETGEQLWVDTNDPRFRQRFAEVARRREAALAAAFRRVGVDVLRLSTEEDLVTAIVRFALARKQRQLHRAVPLAAAV